MSFAKLGLSAPLQVALLALGYQQPTPVQQASIAAALAGRDLRVRAQTGSGKTLAFALPLLQYLLDNPRSQGLARALVLVPTRELATQVGQLLQALAQPLPQRLRVSVLFGGVSVNVQMLRLRGGTDVVVATPGRLLDLLARNALSLGQVQCLVLDEADRLLDLGFSDEMAQVLARLPKTRQQCLFSATFSPAVQTLADTLLRDPVHVEVANADVQPVEIIQRAIAVDAERRLALLRHLIGTLGWNRVLVFVATKYAAEVVADKLRRAGLSAEPFHGELSQGKRTQVLNDFKSERLTAMVATDMAARGLDIAGLPVVLNYDLPRSTVDYTHRIGRTGRAGVAGLAISFVSPETLAHWHLIQKRQRITLTLAHEPGFEPRPDATNGPTPATVAGAGGIKGRRPSKKDRLRALAQQGVAATADSPTTDRLPSSTPERRVPD